MKVERETKREESITVAIGEAELSALIHTSAKLPAEFAHYSITYQEGRGITVRFWHITREEHGV